MKNFTYQLWVLAIFVLSLSSCSNDSMDELETSDLVAVTAPINYTNIEIEILNLINEYRVEKGLTELTVLNEITVQARNHNQHMITAGEICHDNFSSRYSDLVNSINAQAVSENVAYDYKTAEAVVKAWIGSEGHKKNIEGNLTHFGISVKEDAEGKQYFTNIFVRK